MAGAAPKTWFVVTFKDPKDGSVQSVRCRRVSDSSLGLSFVAIGDFVWEGTGPIVLPAEEALRKRLEHVKTLHLSLYAVLSVEEVAESESEPPRLVFENDRSKVLVLRPEGS